MRVLQSIVFAAILSMASLAQAETLTVTVKERVTSADAQAGTQALRALPQTANVYVSTQRRVYAVEVRDGQRMIDSEVSDRLARAGQTVTSIRHSNNSFEYVKQQLKRSPHRYSKWG